LRILVAEDSRYYRKIIETVLNGWGYEVVLAKDGIGAWNIIRENNRPQLAILDWVMPNMNGLELCQTVRNSALNSYVYIILLTGMDKKDDLIAGLKAGADDYIVKPFDEQELKYRIQIGQRIIELENKISRLALTDWLTGLLNRRAFMERLESEVYRSWRLKSPLTLIMADLDNFKRINDEYGHLAGDKVIARFAAEILRHIRKYDFVGRFGGEEFILCIPEAGQIQALEIAERLRHETEDMQIKVAADLAPLSITASFGVYTASSQVFEDSNTLIKKADDYMYQAKTQGKNRVSPGQSEL